MDLAEVAERFGLGAELAKALAKAAKMSPEERQERMAKARAAMEIYQRGQELQDMARLRGDEGTLAWIEEREVLDKDKIWPLEEAATLKMEILDRIEDLYEYEGDL